MSDLIERQDILGALKASCLELGGSELGDGEMGVHKDDIEVVVNSVPSANQWIPCSERLPKTEVLCCDKYGEMIIAYVYEDNTSDTGFSAESETQCMYNCVAWQPLPEPWKGGEE